MKEQFNYNRLALQGFDIDDMDFVTEFNLNPADAYTPKINNILLDLMHSKNLTLGIEAGMPEQEAKSNANMRKAMARNQIKDLYKQRGIKAFI